MELALKNIIDGTETFFAQEYLNKIVLNISSVIKMEYVFIARTNLDNGISSTIVVAANEVLSENFEYELKDTPCEDVAKNSTCIYHSVTEFFPKDKLLFDMGIAAYIGSPLRDSSGNVIGIFVALSKTPIENPDSILTIMQLFSGRISAEMDRMDKELKLKLLNETLENKVKLATMDLQQAQKLSKIGSWRFDTRTNTFKCTDQVYAILGIDENKKVISNLNDFFQLLHADISNNEEIKDIYENHLKNHEPYKETYKINTDIGIKYIEERCETTFDDNGNLLVLNGTIQDVTEEIQRNQILVKQSRMAQMGEMISMIAHQWRQPLGTISSTMIDLNMKLELEVFDFKQEEGIKECQDYFNTGFKEIGSLVQHLTTTIDDFRNFYKPNKETSFVSIIEPVNKALNILKTSFKSEGIDLVQTCIICDKKVEIYSNELMQVVLNILKNAQDNFKEQETKNPKISIVCKCSSDKVILEIFDNGGGIPTDILPKIFDPYFSTKSDLNGTGLGLYMSKIIIENHHNGKLQAINRDNGVCFRIELDAEKEK